MLGKIKKGITFAAWKGVYSFIKIVLETFE